MKAALFLLQLFLLLVSVECELFYKGQRSSLRTYSRRSEESHLTYTCQDKTMVLECDIGSNLRILRANYGRSNFETCDPVQFNINDSHQKLCVTNSAIDAVRTQCENQTRCQIPVNNNRFGDTCPGTFKFLEVEFTCDSRGYGIRSHTWFACEGNRMVLECPDGLALKITRAVYGRSSEDICDPRLLNNDGNFNNCGNDAATGVVATMCNNQMRCQFKVSSALFADVCPTTSKYLQVDFTCVGSDDRPASSGHSGTPGTSYRSGESLGCKSCSSRSRLSSHSRPYSSHTSRGNYYG